jgi:enoyl-CoA hydratase
MSAASTEDIIVARKGSSIWLTLNRPEAYNAIRPSMMDQLQASMDMVEGDRSIRALVITGSQDRFCAGADLKAVLASGSPDDPDRAFATFLRQVMATYSRLERLGVPTIAAVNGLALAGGMELMLCCDLIVLGANAKLGDGHAKFAQLPAAGNSVRLPRRIGEARTKYLMFTGDLLDAEKALSWGLADEIAPAGRLHEAVEALLSRITDKSPLVLERMKSLLHDGREQPLEVALRSELKMVEWHAGSHDRNEGLAAFNERRKPVYKGQ